MAHSLLWERLQVFLNTLGTPPPPPSATKAVIAAATSAVVDTNPTKSRIHALEHALLSANASFCDERAKRTKWERRAMACIAEQASQKESLQIAEKELNEMGKRAEKFEQMAEDNLRARKLAEEQRDVALTRLADSVELAEVEQVRTENNILEERIRNWMGECERIKEHNEELKRQMGEIREAVRVERERFVKELAERTNNFEHLEKELKDARETYIVAADKFEQQRNVLGNKLKLVEKERDDARSGLKITTQLSAEKDAKITQLMRRCEILEMSEHGSPSSVRTVDSTDDVDELRGRLVRIEAERDALRVQLKMDDRVERLERLSCSSISSEASGDAVAKRVQDLEFSMEVEAKEAETLRRKLENVKVKEDEACQSRGEMAAIHTRMRRMENRMERVSVANKADDLLDQEEEEERRKAGQSREKRGLGITTATMNRIHRKSGISDENKHRFR